MKLRFPGTRGEIDIKNRCHRRHSCLLVEERVLVDCGADWLGRFGSPNAIVLTHAHPDHIGGLKRGAHCPVYATQETWARMKRYPIHDRQVVAPFQLFSLCGIRFEAFPVVHSLVAPAVGYRITTGAVSVFYAPDVAEIRERQKVMPGLSLYIGDGASITRPLLRRRGDTMIGHASIRDQLEWCREYAIKQAIITHCGSQIVRDGRAAIHRIQTLAEDRGLEVLVAHDGLQAAVTKSGIRSLD
jgi:phosphoribosyl 1,2-cyclic phosphodiesterase